MAQHCIIGKHGLLGSALALRLGDASSFPTKDTRVVFHFGSYTHPQFEQAPEYQIKGTLSEYAELLEWCGRHGALFVYPSSALVYEKDTQFSRFKKTLEKLAECYETRSLGLRMFPVYGPQEDRTVISQWCRQMSRGEKPIVFGDGKQTRDFIYIDDAVSQIVSLAEERWAPSRVVDIGTGVSTSFNDIVCMINRALGTNIEPKYVTRPSSYSEGIHCANPLPAKTSIKVGIDRILGKPPDSHHGEFHHQNVKIYHQSVTN